MQIQDGFIVGIFNYCDRWCETCAFTSRCRVFATQAEFEAKLDPSLRDVVAAPALEPSPPRRSWWRRLIEGIDARTADKSVDVQDRALPHEHQALADRAMEYAVRAIHWCKHRSARGTDHPVAVVCWHAGVIALKTRRAVDGLAENEGNDTHPADHDGSAKVALISVERSHIAWLELIRRGEVSSAEPFISDLVTIGSELERVFPHARAFVRPGFDEPEAVAELEAAERR